MARVNTKQHILDAAVRVASQQGISGASMDQIAESAGVAKGSLYYNFSSKDALFSQVMQEGFERLGDAIDTARAGNLASGRERLWAVASATLETLRANVDLAKLMAAETFRTDRAWAGGMQLVRASLIVRYRDVLREAREELAAERGRELAGMEPTEIAGAAFFGALAGACLDWVLFHPEQSVDEVLHQVLQHY